MDKFLAFAHDFFEYFNHKLNTLSQPNIRYIHNKIEYEISHIRSKALLTTQFSIVIFFILDIVLNGLSIGTNLFRCIMSLIIAGLLIISNRHHPIFFKILYSIVCLAYGLFIMDMKEGGILRAWFASLIAPIFLYVFVGDLKGFIFQTVVQLCLINKIYSAKMERVLTFMTPEAFIKYLTYSTNVTLIFYVVVILFTHYFMQHAYRRISVVEKKKEEVENQKTFLLGFSHELRNLINSLAGNVKLASLETVASKTKELLLNAEVCGELLLHLVNNILDTGKVEIGELEINPVPTRIHDTLERVWGICSELIKRKNLGGKIRISKDLPKNLMVDHYRLTQIFLNLVGNSVKFTETGSIDISVDWLSQNNNVDESCFQPYPFNYYDDYDEGLFEKQKTLSQIEDKYLTMGLSSQRIPSKLIEQPMNNVNRGVLKIAVSDTGCGMSGEEVQKLFQKFSQVTSDTSKRKLGTGLGLFITKELCRRMQGDIKAFSQKGHGSCFMFCVPADVIREKNDLYSQDIESLKTFVRSRKLKAMIVDDAPFNNTVLKHFFEKLGIEVIDIVSNGLEAYQKYTQRLERGEPLHIITLDIDMPVMDGKETARRIRRMEVEKGVRSCFIPIISGNCSESEIEECLDKRGDIKADRFIKKPTTLDELLRNIGHHFVSLEH